jgi:thiol-disulfide isomerase/thioredoxin
MEVMRVFLLVLTLCCVSCGIKSTEQLGEVSREGRAIEKIRLLDLEGRKVDMAQFEGRALFINVWATWCGPCVKEMPSIANAKKNFRNTDIEFLFVSNEAPESIRDFAAEHPVDIDFMQLENLEEIGIQAMPTTFIFNRNGELVFSEAGYRQWDEQVSLEMIRRIVNDK